MFRSSVISTAAYQTKGDVMLPTAFRQYDIRGIVGREFDITQSYQLGCAISYYFLQKNPRFKTVALCRDIRRDSDFIAKEVVRAFIDAGIDVVDFGVGPTPLMYFGVHTTAVDGGLMVTASHNGKEYNGIKICLGKTSLWGEQIQHIKELYQQKSQYRAVSKGCHYQKPLAHDYLSWLVAHFSHLKGSAQKIIFDLSSGAACAIFPELIERMSWSNVKLINNRPDPFFTAHPPDPCVPAHMTELASLIKSGEFEYGIGFDGDADRMAVMSSDGTLYGGDILLLYFAQELVNLPNTRVIFDIKSSEYVLKVARELGVDHVLSPTGHSLVKQSMLRHKALLGGELSCHFFFADRYFGYDDGIYAALRFMQLHNTGLTLSKVATLIPKTYDSGEMRIACVREDKIHALEKAHHYFTQNKRYSVQTIDGVRITMPHGWAVVRAAHTQDVLSFRFESETQEGLARIIDDFTHALPQYGNHFIF